MTIRNPSTAVEIVDTATASGIEGVAKTADFYSSTYKLGDADYFGVVLSASASSGTSETCDVKIECTYDNGTNWHSYPADENSQTAAALAQITAAGNATPEFWKNWIPTAPDGSGSCGIRIFFDLGGTSPSFTFDTAKLVYVQRSGN
jgi:hypothetical protein